MLDQSLIHNTGSPSNTNLCVAINRWRRGQDSNLLSQLIRRQVSLLVANLSGRQPRIPGVQGAGVDQLYFAAYLRKLDEVTHGLNHQLAGLRDLLPVVI